ncbi:glycoside hydrolase family 27 protein [Micromonospora sp. URMC 105]|uniref:glycoside hydrolase family 27 protein n=1 Tax=Micromonospora sp. URMC 105 TaxID=3423413 RepID=UPI003F1D28BE
MHRSRCWRVLASALTLLATAALAVALPVAPAPAAPGSPAQTPPMGWNSWNTFGCDIDEGLIRGMADAIVSSGMRDAGYSYVVIDDCWFDPQRDAQGNLRANPDRFPSGMKALGDYLHGKDLKFGIYQVPTARTCAQRGGGYPGSTGSLGHERQDAATFAAWGVDYLKYDWCSPDGSRDEQVAAFTLMRDALRATGRDIVYSINPNSYHAVTGTTYNWSAIADLWRTTEDIKPYWDTGNVNSYPMGVVNIVDETLPLAGQAGPGHWNDPDMLEVGVGGLTPTEYRAHFALWAIMAAPLMAGNDIRSMSADVSAVLRNADLIAVNQDPAGHGGRRVRDDGSTEVVAKALADGSVAVALLNRGGATTRIATTTTEVGLLGVGPFTVRDLWTGATSSSTGTLAADVPAHGVAVFRVRGGTPATLTTSTIVGAGSARCLDVNGAARTNGTATIIYDCQRSANQLWTSTPAGELRVYGDKCLDAYDQGTTAGTAVIIWPCNGQRNQKWTWRADGTIVGEQSGLCLDVAGAATTNTTKVLLWTCHGAANQRWSRG